MSPVTSLLSAEPQTPPSCARSHRPMWAATVGTQQFEMYAPKDRDTALEIQLISVSRNACSGDSRRAIAHFLPLFSTLVFTQLYVPTTSLPLKFFSLPALLLSFHKHDCRPSHLLPLLIFHPPLSLSSSTFVSLSPTCLELRLFYFLSLLFLIISPIALLCWIINTKRIIAPCGPLIFK